MNMVIFFHLSVMLLFYKRPIHIWMQHFLIYIIIMKQSLTLVPRSNSPAWKRPVPVILWKQYSGRKFFGFFRWFSAGSCRKAQEVDRNRMEKSGQFRVGILLPCSSDFRCFPAGSGDFPGSFLQDPAGSGGRNHRPGYGRIKDLTTNYYYENEWLYEWDHRIC